VIVVKAGELITINGSAGTVYVGNVAKIDPNSVANSARCSSGATSTAA
jgi:hypothetical protein